MSFFFKNNYLECTDKLVSLFGILKMIAVTWICIWVVNFLSYVGVASITGFLTSALIDGGRSTDPSFAYRFWEFIFFAIGNGWMYCCAIVIGLSMLGYTYFSNNAKILISIVWVIFVIGIYDPRFAELMPAIISTPVIFLHDTCKFCLLGSINIFVFDFSGQISDGLYYTYFDISVVVALLLKFFIGFEWDE